MMSGAAPASIPNMKASTTPPFMSIVRRNAMHAKSGMYIKTSPARRRSPA